MEQFSNILTPEHINTFKEQWTEHILCFLRLEITEFLLQNINKEFYDFTSFFEKFKVSDQNSKNLIMDRIIEELKNLGWHIGSIFGNTAIVIHTTPAELDKCLWATSFDFSVK